MIGEIEDGFAVGTAFADKALLRVSGSMGKKRKRMVERGRGPDAGRICTLCVWTIEQTIQARR